MSVSGLEPGPAASGEHHVPTELLGSSHAKPPPPFSDNSHSAVVKFATMNSYGTFPTSKSRVR